MTPRNAGFLGFTRVHILNGISIGSSVLSQLMVVTNRHTDTHRHMDDHATWVTTDRILLLCMRFGLKVTSCISRIFKTFKSF